MVGESLEIPHFCYLGIDNLPIPINLGNFPKTQTKEECYKYPERKLVFLTNSDFLLPLSLPVFRIHIILIRIRIPIRRSASVMMDPDPDPDTDPDSDPR